MCFSKATPETRSSNASKKKGRGINKNNKVANLKNGEKLEVDYFNDRPVGENQNLITRHMGRIVRDRSICPARVHKWRDIDKTAKEHMWQVVLVHYVNFENLYFLRI